MNTPLDKILVDVTRLEPFPRVAIRVLELALNDAEVDEIVAVAEQDPGLTSKILKLTNSVRYAGVNPTESVHQAVMRLGQKTIASLAMTSGCTCFFMGYGSSTPRSNTSLWQECLHVAVTARQLAKMQGTVNPELAYTIGLLQNIGHIVMDRFLEQSRDSILAEVDDGSDMLEAERAILGLDHAECGARIASKWNFPDSLVRGILFHHMPSLAGDLKPLSSITNLAEDLTARHLTGKGTSMLYPSTDLEGDAPDLDEDGIRDLLESVRDELLNTELAVA